MSRIHKLIPLTCVVACMAASAQNQQQQQRTATQIATPGTFSGKLNGAGMDGAAITLTGSSSVASQSTTADNDGNFTFNNVAPGSYRVAVRLKSGLQLGESTLQMDGSGAQVQASFSNATASGRNNGGVPEVESRSPTLQTEAAEVSRSYDTFLIRSLPLLDRQNQELITLMPGITPPVLAQDRATDPQRTRSFNVNGLPAYTNLYNQDGIYDNEPFSGRPLRVEPIEGVEALQVRTSNYNAEYGVSAGAWSSALTRPGTNMIHGSAFGFNTNNFFQTGRSLQASQSTPRFSTNQFGGTLGGPIVPGKLFWFVSYEGLMQRGRVESVATVPTANVLNGNFSGVAGATIYSPITVTMPAGTRTLYPNNTLPASAINPAAAQIVALLPAANLAGSSNNLIGSTPLLDDNHRADGRIDQRFSERTTGFLRYGFTEGSLDQGSLLGALGNPVSSEFRAMTGSASITTVIRPSLVGEFRVGYDRYRNQLSPWGDFSSLNRLANVGFPRGLPSISITGYTPLGYGPNVPSKQIDNVYDGATNWIHHIGINKVSFGVSARALEVNGIGNSFFSSNGTFNFGAGSTLNTTAAAATLTPGALQANAFASFLTGTPSQSGISNYIGNPGYRQKQYAAYVSDTVNIFQRLWLEVGVRYDIFSPLQSANAGGAVIYDPASNTSAASGANNGRNNIYRYDLNNVAPRVGLAFRPVDRFVFRAGYGIHYFALPFALVPFNPASQSIQNGVVGGLGFTTFATPIVPAASATNAANTPFLYGPRDFRTPYVQTVSAMIQGDLGNGFLMDVGYVGNVGRQLPYQSARVGRPGTGLTGLPVTGRTATSYEVAPGLNSNYNSLQVNMTKKFGAGLALAAAYTWSKALDSGFILADPFNRANNRGPSDWDRTHILSMSHVWQLPFGAGRKHMTSGWAARALGDWQLNGIFRWSTGNPFTVTADPLACACIGTSSIPAAYNSASLGSGIGGSSFNPNFFSTPAAGSFGTLSRNAFRGPDLQAYNAAIFRNFTVNENVKLELRGEGYNLLNSLNLQNPVSNIQSPGFGSSVGNINGLAGRQFQVAVRILF